mgnify:CR=1 FL=1
MTGHIEQPSVQQQQRHPQKSHLTLTGNVFSGLRDRAVSTQGDCRRVAFVGNAIAAGAAGVADNSVTELSSVSGAATT